MSLPLDITGQGTASSSGYGPVTVTAVPAEGWYLYEIRIYAFYRTAERLNATLTHSPATFPALYPPETYYYTRIEVEFRETPTYYFNVDVDILPTLQRDPTGPESEGALASVDPHGRVEITPYTTYTFQCSATPDTENWKFLHWSCSTAAMHFTDETNPDTTANITIKSATYFDITFHAVYIRKTDVTLSVRTYHCTCTPDLTAGEAPLTCDLAVTPDQFCHNVHWDDLADGPNYNQYNRSVTITADTVLKVMSVPDTLLCVEIKDDLNYGTIVTRPYKIAIEQGNLPGLQYYYPDYPGAAGYTSSQRISCIDNPGRPPGTVFLKQEWEYGYYNIETKTAFNMTGLVEKSRKPRENELTATWITQAAGTVSGQKNVHKLYHVVFYYTQLSGGEILHGDNSDLIYGEDGGLLFGFGEYANS